MEPQSNPKSRSLSRPAAAGPFAFKNRIISFWCAVGLTFSCAAGQAPPVAVDSEARTDESDQSAALKVLEQVAENQGGARIARNLRNFRASFKLELFDPEKGRGNFEIERVFAFEGDSGIIWTRKRLSAEKKTTTLVHNGTDAWRVGKKGELTIFTDKPSLFKTDITNLEDDIRLTGQLLRFFFVSTLIDKVKELELTGERSEGGVPKAVLEGRTTAWLGEVAPGGEVALESPVLLTITVDRKKNIIDEVKLIDLSRDGLTRIFRFTKYFRNPQGILVPGNIKVFNKKEGPHEMQIGFDVEILEKENAEGKRVKVPCPQIEFNVDIPEELFTLPA